MSEPASEPAASSEPASEPAALSELASERAASTGELADALARERIRTDLGSSLFVDAGAGTGKTAALVDRVVALVLAGAEMRHIAAITFTEAAAAELADRVRGALEEVLGAGGPPAESARRALDQLDAAALTTIHGFARRLLAEHPFPAGLPPVLDVVDGVGQAIQTEEWWRVTLAELLRNGSLQGALERAIVVGLTIADLRSLAMAMHVVDDRLAEVALRPAAGGPPAASVDVDAVVGPVWEALAVPCADEDDKLLQHLLGLRSDLEALLAETDPLERLRLLASCPVIASHNLGSAANWHGQKTLVVGLLEEAEGTRQTQLEGVRGDVLDTLLPALAERVVAWGVARRAAGRPQFHDLLVWARDLLHDQPEVRHLAADRWRHLLVDEFQDVDPLQAELADLLAGADEGRLFVVGDPKQSIYRFRGADIGLYLRFKGRHPEGLVRLTTSFRSVPAVIEWSNAVFVQLLEKTGASVGHGDQAEHVPLEPRRPSSGAWPPPVLVVGSQAEPGVPMREVRREESVALVELIRRMRAEGWPVADGPAERAVRYADIALLIPTRAALPALERALEELDVPYRVESRSLVFATDEVRTVLHVLAAVDDPGDQVAVVGALRSPALACTDKELLEWRQAGGRWDWRSAVPSPLPPDHAVARAMAQLQALAELRWSKTVGELAGEVVGRLRLLDLSLAHRRPRDHWRRLRFIVDQARAYDEGGGRTVREFVSWVRQQAEEGATVNTTVVPEADDDAVRILTMHGSKGLEFPVVVLAGLGTKPTRRPSPVLFDDDGMFQARLGAPSRAHCQTAGYAALHAAEQEAIKAEELRLLYVAATRARDRLVVGLHHPHTDKESIALRLRDALVTCPERWSVPPPAQTVETVGQVLPPPLATGGEHGAEQLAAWAEHRARLLAEGARAPVTAATRLAGDIEVAVAVGRGGGRRLGSAVGRAVHAVLQAVDLASGDGADALANAQAEAEEIPEESATVAALVRSVLTAAPVRQAATGRHWREVYVAAEVEGTLLEGFVDLLYEAPEGLVVVDFKTDAAVDAAAGRYRLQLAAYAAALEALLGRAVARCTLVFADAQGGEAEVVDVDDLPEAVADVRTRLVRSAALAVPEPWPDQELTLQPVQQVLFDLPMAGAVPQ